MKAAIGFFLVLFFSDVCFAAPSEPLAIEHVTVIDSTGRPAQPDQTVLIVDGEELGWLVEDGFTPLEALQSATRDAAEFLGKTEEFGTIVVGKRADLVLLDANPLERIGNSTTIRAVVRDGKLLDRAALLAQAMAAAAEAK